MFNFKLENLGLCIYFNKKSTAHNLTPHDLSIAHTWYISCRNSKPNPTSPNCPVMSHLRPPLCRMMSVCVVCAYISKLYFYLFLFLYLSLFTSHLWVHLSGLCADANRWGAFNLVSSSTYLYLYFFSLYLFLYLFFVFITVCTSPCVQMQTDEELST